jgi:hypothetical protein
VLAGLLPDGGEGSISTLPLAFKEFRRTREFFNDVVGRLIEAAAFLRKIKDRTGRTIRLAIEPEPFCLLETTTEALAFFDQFRKAADRGKVLDVVTEHVGVCFDVCHQAVEFEDVADSIRRLAAAGVRINKVHLSCALQLDDPANNEAGRKALLQYVEPRYLHQTLASSPTGGWPGTSTCRRRSSAARRTCSGRPRRGGSTSTSRSTPTGSAPWPRRARSSARRSPRWPPWTTPRTWRSRRTRGR